MKKDNLFGQRFGRLVVIQEAHKTSRSRWTCRCDCGQTTVVNACHLKAGAIVSCGCFRNEQARRNGLANVKHGGRKTPEFRSYSMMRERCLNQKSKSYINYGGRGITICQRWLDDFRNFRADMGERPAGTSLDRIDNDGDYEPENCRWATRSQQARNSRTTRWFVLDGVAKPLRDWIAACPWERSTVYKRLQRGMPLADAIRP